MATAQFHPLRIADLRRETVDTVSLAFDVPDAIRADFAFRPGQYLTLRTRIEGAEIRRSYSICSGLDDGEIRVAIKHVPSGLFSRHANIALRVGDTVEVMPPDGRFGLAETCTGQTGAGQTYVGIAAGSGITPILSILRTILAREPDSRFILFYGSRSTAGILFREVLEDLKDRYLGRLSVLHILSREAQDLAILNGRLDGAKLRTLLPSVVAPDAIDHVFICGPGGMIEDASAVLADLHVQPGRIHVERFTPSGDPVAQRSAPIVASAAASVATATVVHDGTATEIPVADGESVLDAALRAGLDLPWSCHAGMCSTCRARLTEGAATMTVNFSLEPWETEAGFVLTCQAHPTTPHVRIDYDHV